MKNIHVLPTENESRLVKSKFSDTLLLADMASKRAEWKRFNIYITSDEEIEDGDWVYFILTNEVIKVPLGGFKGKVCKKIILTTDQYLIKDGVQAIDDAFLEWFVKNPSCEFVNIEKYHGINTSIAEVNYIGGDGSLSWQGRSDFRDYKIIIPKEDEEVGFMSKELDIEKERSLKQETLEEAAERYSAYSLSKVGFIEGAKWQQEQDKNKYSEENIIDFIANELVIEKKEFIMKKKLKNK
jgi:hypothetical protein